MLLNIMTPKGRDDDNAIQTIFRSRPNIKNGLSISKFSVIFFFQLCIIYIFFITLMSNKSTNLISYNDKVLMNKLNFINKDQLNLDLLIRWALDGYTLKLPVIPCLFYEVIN